MTNENFSFRLMSRMSEKTQTLTLKLDLETLVEFSVAARIFRARSVASFLHYYVVNQINEAKKLVSSDEWKRFVAEQRKITLSRSRAKSENGKAGKTGVRRTTIKVSTPDKLRKTG